jgi:hypothetical protein
MNVTTVITANGTERSERAFGLDDGEVSTFTIRPGEYDSSIDSIAEHIARIEHSAHTRGEWISELLIGGVDVVQSTIVDALDKSCGDIEITVRDLLEVPLFCNADAGDLSRLVARAAAARAAGQ